LAVRRRDSWAGGCRLAVGAGLILACANWALFGLLSPSSSWAVVPAELRAGGLWTQQSMVTPNGESAGGAGSRALMGWNATRGGYRELRFGRWPAVVGLDAHAEIDWSALGGVSTRDSVAFVSPIMVARPALSASGLGWRQRRQVLDSNTEFGPRLRRVSQWNLASDNGPLVRWVVWEERFFDARDAGWGPESGFDQSRAFVGWAWLAGPWVRDGAASLGREGGRLSWGGPPSLLGLGRPTRVEFGYLNQAIDHPGRDSDQRLHFLSFNVFF